MQKITSNFIPALLTILATVAVVYSVQTTYVNAWAGGTDNGQGGCCGGGDKDPIIPTPPTPPNNTPDPDPDPQPVIPVCVINAAPRTITAGGNATLTWTTTKAATAVINQGIGSVAIGSNKTRVVSPANTVTYVMTVRSTTGNTATCRTTVTVNPPVVVPAPVCNSFTATPASIVRGNAVTLNWATTNADTVVINQGIGSVAVDGSRSVSPQNTLTYTLTATKGAKSVTCPVTVTVRNVPPTPLPTCDSFTASPASIVRGNSATLNWGTTNADSVVINQGIGSVAVDGSRVVSPLNTITFTLTAIKGENRVTCPVTVTVRNVPAPVLPTCDSFTATPASIVRGNASTLNWTTTNADSVVINQGIGSVAVDGSRSVSPTNTTTYTLTAVKGTISVTCPVTVTVRNVPTPNAPVCDSFTANAATINRGEKSTLTWTTTNASSVVINQGIGSVNVDGSFDVTPSQTTTYNLTAVSSNNQQDTCPVTVTVNQPTTAITCAANVTFTANQSSIRRGESSTLTWTTTGLTNVRFDNLTATGLSGSVTVSPSDTLTYTLIGTKGSQTVSCPVTVNVSSDNNGGGGGGGSSSPKCTLKISDSKISLGERVTITWDTSRATEVTLKDSHGKTLIDTDDKSSSEKKDLYDGEITLRPEKDTTYTLEASKGSRDKTCKVSVDVEDTIVVTQVRDQQPLVTGISLTQVPYTGFEAGPFMTSVFYTLLAAFALYLAYVLVSRRNLGSVSAFTPATVTADVVHSETLFPTKVTSAPVFYQAPLVAASVAPTATVGYAAHVDATTALEAQAHTAHVLLSHDALAYFIAATAAEDRESLLASILTAAKASYPSEEGWVTLTADRMIELAKSN